MATLVAHHTAQLPLLWHSEELTPTPNETSHLLLLLQSLGRLDELGIRGFTYFEQVQGRGSNTGEPRRGTHTWPEMNSAVITVVPDEHVASLLLAVRKLDLRNREIGVRAFV